jgi:hypothetical protein
MTTLSLSHPYATKDGTKPYLAKLVKGLIKDYKGTEIGRAGASVSLEIVLIKDCIVDIRIRDI